MRTAARGTDAEAVWRNTILLRSRQTIVVRRRYRRTTGRFVVPSRILDHEDKGMMQVIEVVR